MLSYRAMFIKSREMFDLTKAWLLEHLDYFGLMLSDHGVQVDPNFNRFTFDDIIDLKNLAKNSVREKFGITLEEEVRVIEV